MQLSLIKRRATKLTLLHELNAAALVPAFHAVAIGNESVRKIIINSTINFSILVISNHTV